MKTSPPIETLPALGLAETLFLSFVSQVPYRVAALTWRVRAWVYLLLLVTIVQFPNLFRTMEELKQDVTRVVTRVSSELPEFAIQGGRLRLPGAAQRKELLFNLSTFGVAPRLIVDATLETPVFPNDAGITVMVTAYDISVRFPDGQVHSSKLSLAGDMSLNADTLATLGDAMVRVCWVILPFFMFVGGFFVLAFRVVLLGLSGWTVFPHGRARLPFAACVRVAVVASGPSAILDGILAAIGISSFGWSLASLLLAVTYFMYGVRTFIPPRESEEEE